MLDVLLLVGKHRRLFMGLFGLGVLLYIVLLCASAATRKPWNDEAEAAAAGYNLAYKGFDGVQFFDEKTYGLPGVNKHSYYIFPFQICVLAAWFRIVPFSLLSLRVLAMLWAGVMFVAIYYAARKLLDDGVIAFVATVLTALNYQVMTAASFGR